MKVALNTSNKVQVKKEQLTAAKDTALLAGFTYQGAAYPCDAVFQLTVNSYLTMYREGIWPVAHKCKLRRLGNSFASFSWEELRLLFAALMSHVTAVWDNHWAAKDALPVKPKK